MNSHLQERFCALQKDDIHRQLHFGILSEFPYAPEWGIRISQRGS